MVRAAGADIGRLDADAPPPDDQEARRSTQRALDEARGKQSSAQRDADDAQADLDAARLLAEDAREVREDDAGVAARALDEARDEAVAGKSIWEKIRDKLSLAFGIIGGILGVLAMLVPGLQGIGLALTIGSFAFSAAAFGINIAKSAQTGEWDPLDIVLSVIGLGLGAGAIFKAGGSIGSLLKGIPKEIKDVPTAFKGIPRNIKVAFNDYKNLPGDIIKGVKGLGSKIDDYKWVMQFPKNPMGALTTGVGNALNAMLKFRPSSGRLPTVPGLLGVTARWSRPDVAGFFLGVAGLIYGPAAYAGHTAPPVHDGSYVEGST